MRISITDDYQNVIKDLACFTLLDEHDVTIINEYIENEDELVVALDNPDAIVLNRTRTKITESLLSRLPNLKAISQTGKNAGHIDVKACAKYGVKILEGRGDPVATAELTWLLIMNGLRLLPQAISGMKRGNWQINIGRRIKGKKIGIWSYGRIGKLVASYARAFGADVIVWGSKNSVTLAKKEGFQIADSKGDFFQTCDVISIHLRLSPSTRGIIKKDDLMSMKPDALFVNTSRAGLVDSGSLLESLKLGRPGYAALDVFEDEPIFDQLHALLQMPNVICTPHLGYVEMESFELYFSIAFQNLVDFFSS